MRECRLLSVFANNFLCLMKLSCSCKQHIQHEILEHTFQCKAMLHCVKLEEILRELCVVCACVCVCVCIYVHVGWGTLIMVV